MIMRKTMKREALFVAATGVGMFAWASFALAGPGETSFTPLGLRVSIMQISLARMTDAGSPTAQQILYTCAHASEDECLVDVTDQSQLDAISAAAGSANVEVGAYDMITLNLCRPGSNGMMPAPGYVRGAFSVQSENKSYVTDPSDASVTGLKEAEPDASAEFTSIGNWSCSSKSILLREPMTIGEGTTTPLTVVFDSMFIASSTPNVSPGMGGCRGAANGNARGICVSYPSIVPFVGEGTPELERFLVSHHRTDATSIDDAKANGYVAVVRAPDGGAPLTAFVRPYFSETSATPTPSIIVDSIYGGPGYFGETTVSSFTTNPDGTLAFETGGSLDDHAAIFRSFTLADHRSSVDMRVGGAWFYHAMPIP